MVVLKTKFILQSILKLCHGTPDIGKLKMTMRMGMGNPTGMGTIQNDGNGQEWKQILLGMGMYYIPMGIDTHRLV